MSELYEAEVLYSPSRWSKRLSADVICEEHINITRKYSQEVNKFLQCQLNIPYGNSEREVFDIFGTDLRDEAPIFIYVHGGYWQEETMVHSNLTFISKNLHKHKIKSLFIGYKLCPTVKLNEIQTNIEHAVGKCLDYAKRCKSRGIHIAGHSAGAQLVINLFENFIPSLPESDCNLFKSAFLLAGIYDLTPLLKTSYNIPLQLNESTAIEASPLYKKLSGNTTFFVIVAEYDSPAFVEEGEKLHKYLSNLELKSNYIFVKNVDHFDLIERLIEEKYEITELIIRVITE